MRKSVFDDARGERFDYAMLALSNAVLIKNLDRDHNTKVPGYEPKRNATAQAEYSAYLSTELERWGDELVGRIRSLQAFEEDHARVKERVASTKQKYPEHKTRDTLDLGNEGGRDSALATPRAKFLDFSSAHEEPGSIPTTPGSRKISNADPDTAMDWIKRNKHRLRRLQRFAMEPAVSANDAIHLSAPDFVSFPRELLMEASSKFRDPSFNLYNDCEEADENDVQGDVKTGKINLYEIARLYKLSIERILSLAKRVDLPEDILERIDTLTHKWEAKSQQLRLGINQLAKDIEMAETRVAEHESKIEITSREVAKSEFLSLSLADRLCCERIEVRPVLLHSLTVSVG